MNKHKKEILVGLIAIAIAVTFFWGINYLKGKRMFSSSRIYYTKFPAISGLSRYSPIVLNGLKIGVVNDFYFSKQDYNNVIMELSIEEEDLKIPEDTKINLVSSNLLGGKMVTITLGSSSVYKEIGDTLSSSIEMSMISSLTKKISPYKDRFNSLTASVDTTLMKLHKLVSEKNTANIETLIIGLNDAVRNVSVLMVNMGDRLNELKPVISKSNKLIGKMNEVNYSKTATKLEQSLDEIKALSLKLQNPEGTLGKLMTTTQTHDNLNQLLKDLDKLIVDINTSPKKYVHFSVFGRKEKKAKKETK